jgi:hypothetical protein
MLTTAEVHREAHIFTLEQYGSETCEISTNSSFVLVHIPIRLVGEGKRAETTFRYSIGSFTGRDTNLAPMAKGHTTLRLRIPQELFRPRERLTIEVLAGSGSGPAAVLWTKRWEITWRGKVPGLEPITE